MPNPNIAKAAGILGRKRKTRAATKAAVILGRQGGKVTSERKAAAARENGKLGGRPRKNKGAPTL